MYDGEEIREAHKMERGDVREGTSDGQESSCETREGRMM